MPHIHSYVAYLYLLYYTYVRVCENELVLLFIVLFKINNLFISIYINTYVQPKRVDGHEGHVFDALH